MGIVSGRCPADGLRYPKVRREAAVPDAAEIERQLPGLPPKKAASCGNPLPDLPEVERLLAHVKARAAHPWIHPLLATAAHTGARRGELLRMRVGDVDFAAGVVSIQERKRAHGRRTTRRVPLSTALAAILADWLKIHPGGPSLFAQAEEVERSRKRSRTTGHLWKDRPGVEEGTACGRHGAGASRHPAADRGRGYWPLQADAGLRMVGRSGIHTLRH